MPTELKSRIKFYAMAALCIIPVATALAVLLSFLLAKSAPPAEPQPTTLQTQITTTLPIEQSLPPSAFAQTDFVTEGEYLSCPAGDAILGIDVSHHQQEIDWAQVKESGIQFVMVRLGYRGLSAEGTLYTDRYVHQNLQGAREAGLLVGAYFYSQAISTEEAVAEAEYALSILGDFDLDLPLTYDWEEETRNAGMDPQTVTDCAVAFCQVVEQAGLDTMIYFNSYQATELMHLLQLTRYPWWLAMYNREKEFPCRFDMWQYTSSGSVPGIEGNVDMNLLFPSEDIP